MANVVEIVIKTKDESAAGFSSFDAKLKKLEDGTDSSVTRVKEKFKKAGEDSSKALGDGIDNDSKKTRGRIESTFAKLGEGVAKTFTNSSGKLISEGFSDSMKSVLTSPAVLGVGAALAAILIPAIGAALSSGVMLGLGGGVIAAGVMAAIKAPGVQAALDTFKGKATAAFDSFGKAFQGPVARAMQTFGDMVDRLSPAFNRIGAAAAPLIDKLAPALAGMAERAMPGIEHAMNNMGPVFDALASILPQMGEDIGRFFATISDQGPGTVQFIKDLGKAFGAIMDNTSRAISALTWVYGKLRGADDAAKDTGKSTQKMGQDFSKAAEKTKNLAERMDDLTQKMLAAVSGQLSMRAATRAYEGAIDKLADAVKHGARGIDEHTEKGRANAEMLDAVASGAKGAAEAARRMGQSNVAVTGILERGASQYTRQAMSLGLNRKAALDLTASIFGIPTARKTALEMLGVAKGKRELAEIRAALYALNSRQIYVDVVTRYSHKGTPGASANAVEAYRSGGIMSTAATGGVRRGMTLVGEDGPELIDAGGMVYNAGKTKQILAGAQGGGSGITIGNLHLSLPSVRSGSDLIREIERWSKDNGAIVLRGGVRTA